jgi:acyl dehydratase
MSVTVPYVVQAYNTARDSENKMHDDTVARRYGFTGGLVPGVDVYAYMVHAPVARWGRAWLGRGRAECRFLKPVYDGDEAIVETAAEGDGLVVTVRSHGEACATGSASLVFAAGSPPEFATPPASPANRPPADERSLAVGTLLGMRPTVVTVEYAARYLADVRESDPLYAREGIAHPGIVLRTCNWALSHNVVLGPWMHVGSTVQNIGLARVGDELTVRARVSANYERKGHRFVELEALVLASERPVAHIAHIAIYRPRQATA